METLIENAHLPIVEVGSLPDLAMPGDLIEIGARTAIKSLLGPITGVSVGEIAARRQRGWIRVAVDLQGWSPTLHGVKGTFTADIEIAGGDGVVSREAMLNHVPLRNLASLQTERAEAGSHMGLYEPMPPGGMLIPVGPGKNISRRMPTELRHLHVDASLPAVLTTAGEDPASDLAEGLRLVHGSPRWLLERGDHGLHENNDAWVQEIDTASMAGAPSSAPRTLRVVGRAASLLVPDGMTGSYDGRRLRLTGHRLPDTVIAAMPGNRLDAVIRLHTALDHRIIDAVEMTDGDTIAIALVPHLMPLDRAIALIGRDEED